MTAREIIAACEAIGIVLTRNGGSVHVHATHGELPSDIRAAIITNKPELMSILPPRECPGPSWQRDWQGRWVDLTGLHVNGSTATPHELGSISKGLHHAN